MRGKKLLALGGMALACLLCGGAVSSVMAQGRGFPGQTPNGPPGGRPVGSERFPTNDRSRGGRSNSNTTVITDEGANSRATEEIRRERARQERHREADEEMRRNPAIAERLSMTPEEVRAFYQEALEANHELRFGQFVAAHRLAHHLGARHPNVTPEAILSGLAQRKNLGRILQDLGVSSQESRDTRQTVEREMREGRSRS